ncbi:hypothetical protein KP509_01G085500 [Ceratopteris richardii]|nr:hypothetical protein KP509_01G085500 [Ceratopteris richardii]
MLEDGIQCDEYTYVSLFKACGNTIDLEHGMCLHIEAAKKGFTSDVYVRSTLISMYGKCDALAEAENIFFGMLEHTVVSWNAMLSAYVEQRHGDSALQLFVQMQITGVNPSYLTFVIALQACLTLLDRWRDSFDGDTFCKAVVLDVGQALHSDAARRNLLSNKFVCSMLVTLYGRCGEVSKAEHAYCFLPEYSLVSCTSLLSAYVDHGHTEKALLFYVEMEKWGVVWDHVMITCVLQACSLSGNLEICKHLHFIIVSAGYDDVLPLVATLIHCYGNCAYMVDGQVCFDGLPESNLVLWNACISAHAAEGNLFACLDMFENLSLVGLLPDGVTFNSALCACSHSGHFLRGLEYFSLMIDHYYLTPDMKHYGSILDLLARAGNFKLVKHVLQSMTFPADLSVWLCLLGACRVHGNLQLARQAFHEAIALQPKQDTAYVVMSGFYEDRTLWEGISASYEE